MESFSNLQKTFPAKVSGHKYTVCVRFSFSVPTIMKIPYFCMGFWNPLHHGMHMHGGHSNSNSNCMQMSDFQFQFG